MSGRYPDFIKIAHNSQVDYVTGDLHLGHEGLFLHTFRKHFFKDIKEADDYIISTYNQIVSKKAYIVILGDVAWKNHKYYLDALNGKKIIILGNHDKMSTRIYKTLTGVYPRWIRTVAGELVTFDHYPMSSWPKSIYGSLNLYGHCHGRKKEGFKIRFDVGLDAWGYRPLPWNIIIKKTEMLRTGEFRPDYGPDNPAANTFYLAKKNLQLLKESGMNSKELHIREDILSFFQGEWRENRSLS